MKRAAILMTLMLSACAGRNCTLIGCSSGLYVDISEFTDAPGQRAVTARLCGDDACRNYELTADAPGPQLTLTLPDDGAHPMRVTLQLTRNGATVLSAATTTTLERLAPNGEGCAPICYQAMLTLRGGQLVARAG